MNRYIKEQIYKTVQDIYTYIELLDYVNDQRRITLYLNIKQCIGLYFGYMDCLRWLNKKEYGKIQGQCKKAIKDGLKKIEELYK